MAWEKITNAAVRLWDSVTIIYHIGMESNCKSYVIDQYSTPQEEPETLGQIELWFKKHFGRMLPCMVISESGLEGRIYRYGNHGNYWELTGETVGYA